MRDEELRRRVEGGFCHCEGPGACALKDSLAVAGLEAIPPACHEIVSSVLPTHLTMTEAKLVPRSGGHAAGCLLSGALPAGLALGGALFAVGSGHATLRALAQAASSSGAVSCNPEPR